MKELNEYHKGIIIAAMTGMQMANSADGNLAKQSEEHAYNMFHKALMSVTTELLGDKVANEVYKGFDSWGEDAAYAADRWVEIMAEMAGPILVEGSLCVIFGRYHTIKDADEAIRNGVYGAFQGTFTNSLASYYVEAEEGSNDVIILMIRS